ncbi:MAG TPA: hypothetical protein VH044_15430 [Polyangiaceae bacterium]|jgi:hypothetical protein|nr:hypothetical protein [Polyangiaceae bacterium]
MTAAFTLPRGRAALWATGTALTMQGILMVFPAPARAQAPSADLMARLASNAARYLSMRTRASYSIDGRMEMLDGEGKANSVKEMKARVEANGVDAHFVVVRYVEDGEDKTADAQKEARKKAQERKSGKEKRLSIPILAEEQPRYVFDQLESDPADPDRVRIGFVPKVPKDDTIEGSAWIDSRSANLISVGFKISKPPMFVDFVHVTLEFGAPTAIGPAVSRVVADGDGGLLFFRKRFHATATLSDYTFTP